MYIQNSPRNIVHPFLHTTKHLFSFQKEERVMTSFAMCRSMKCDLYYIYMLYMFIVTSANFTSTIEYILINQYIQQLSVHRFIYRFFFPVLYIYKITTPCGLGRCHRMSPHSNSHSLFCWGPQLPLYSKKKTNNKK